MRRSRSLHPNKLPPILTKFVQLVFDRLNIKLAGQKFSLNSKRNDFVFPFIHICLKKLFLPNASGSYWPDVVAPKQTCGGSSLIDQHLAVLVMHFHAVDPPAQTCGEHANYENVIRNCLVSCDHIPRRSMPLFRAKAVLDELIAGFPPRSPSHRSTSSGRSTA